MVLVDLLDLDEVALPVHSLLVADFCDDAVLRHRFRLVDGLQGQVLRCLEIDYVEQTVTGSLQVGLVRFLSQGFAVQDALVVIYL